MSADVSGADAATLRSIKTDLDVGLSFARMAARTSRGKKARPGDVRKIKRHVAHASTAHDAIATRVGTARGKPEDLRKIDLNFSELWKLLGLDEKL